MGILTIVGIIQSGNLVHPEMWIAMVHSIWISVFGLVMIFLQRENSEEKLVSQAAFLGTRCGRGLFYLFCGNLGGAGIALSQDSELWLKVVGWITFSMCWTLGFTEFCDFKREKSAKNRLPNEVDANTSQVRVEEGR